MEKRLTVDLPDEIHKELLKFQLQEFIDTGVKRSLGSILKEIIVNQFSSQKKPTQN